MTASRLVVVTALALALAAGASVSAQGDTQDGDIAVIATIYTPGAAPQQDEATISDLEGGCQTTTADPAQYGTNGTPEPATKPPPQEWALSTVLTQCLPTAIPISAITQITVLEPNGQPDLNSAAQLTAADLSPQGDFPDDTVPVFWDTGSAVVYERPSRGSTDDNIQDSVTVKPGEDLQFDVFEGETPVNVTISASATSIKPGRIVRFTASAPGNPPGETYSWNVDGAAPNTTGVSTSIEPNVSGVYDITVQATGPEDGFGALLIKVGSPPTKTGTNTITGPTESSGDTPGVGAGQPKHGTGVTKQRPKPKPEPNTTTTSAASSSPISKASGGAGTAGLTQTASGSATTSSPATSAVVRTTTIPPTKTVPTTTTTTTTAATATAHPPKLPPASGPAVTRRPPKDVRVQGRLLGGVIALSGGSSTLLRDQTPQGSAPQLDRPGTGDPWRAIVAALGVLALLGLGATRELRSIRSAR